MIEEWRDIKGFEGIYRISNCGRLLRISNGKEKILSNRNEKGDYLTVVLRGENRKRKHTRIHRLVYEAFVGEIPEGYDIHHRDGNKQNNHITNLVLLSEKEHHKLHIEKNPRIIEGMRHYNKVVRPEKILQFSLDDVLLAEYPNAEEAYRQTGVCSRNILMVAHKTEWKPGKIRKQAGGYIWKIKESV